MADPIPAEQAKSPGEQLAAALAEPVVETPVVETPKTLADRVREFGFADVKDDTDAQERLLAAYQERDAQAQQAARRAQELEELAYLRQQQQPVAPAAAPADGKWWNPPQVDEVAVGYYRNDDGTWKDGAPVEVRQSVQRYEAYQKQWAQKILNKPDEAFTPMVDEIVERKLAERMAAMEAKTNEEAVTQRFLREADWAFVIDPVTKTRRKDHQGNFLPSADGLKFGDYMQQAAEVGIGTVAGQLQYAQQLRELDMLRAQAGQSANQQAAQQTNDQKKQELLNRAKPGVSQQGTFQQPGQPPRSQNRNLTPGQKLLDQMKQDGTLAPA